MKNNFQLSAIDQMLCELEEVKTSQESLLNKVSDITSEANPATGDFLQKEISNVQTEAKTNFDNMVNLIKELQDHRRGFLKQYNLEVI